MTNTFEDQLREDLHAATSHTAYRSIDPAQVIGEGSRLVQRRRRQRGGLGAVAAVAVLAVGGFLVTDHGRATTAPPAGPSTTTSPASTRSAVFNPGIPANRQFVVDVAPEASAESNVSYYEVDVTTRERTLLGRSSTRGMGDGMTWGTGDPASGVILGLVPKDAYSAVPLFVPQPTSGFDMAVEMMEGTGYQAFMLGSEDAATLEAFQGLVWSMPGGTVHGPSGVLPVADFPGAGAVEGVRVWVAPELKVFGLDRMGVEEAIPVSGRLSVHFTSYLDVDTERATAFGLVERGSRDVSLRFSDGTTVTRPVDTAPVGDTGYDAFLAEASGREGTVRLLEVSWTDPFGSRQSRTVGKD